MASVGKHYIQKLYANSKICVRVGNTLSPSVPLQRGLRQGCPLSPILFTIFINDILHPVIQTNEWDPSMEGLMFADDIFAVADDGDIIG